MNYAICPHCKNKLPINSMKACDCTCPHPKPKGAAICDECIMVAINNANEERTGMEKVPGAGVHGLTKSEIRSLRIVRRNAR